MPGISTKPATPDSYEEDVIADDSMDDVSGVSEELCITHMVDSLVYSYCTYNKAFMKQTQHTGNCTWHCSMKRKALTSLAIVTLDGSTFIHGAHPHVHQAQPGAAVKAKVTTNVKTMARDKDNLFKSATILVDHPTTQTAGSNTARVNPDYTACITNHLPYARKTDLLGPEPVILIWQTLTSWRSSFRETFVWMVHTTWFLASQSIHPC